MAAARQAGIPIEMPVEIENGVARIDVTGAHERVADFGKMLEVSVRSSTSSTFNSG